MNSTELVSFISQFTNRIDNFEREWNQWKSLVSVNPRSTDLWSSKVPSGEWICLGTLRCSQDILPLEVNQAVHLGSKEEPFHSVHIKDEIHFENGNGKLMNGEKTAWTIDGIGCQGFGNIAGTLAANFQFTGRGHYQLTGVEVGENWLRVHFPNDWPLDKKHISLFLHLHDRIEIDGAIRRITHWDTPDKAILDEPFPQDLIEEWKGEGEISSFIKNIIVYPTWLVGHLNGEDASQEKPFLTITDDGRIFFRCQPNDKDPEDFICGTEARFKSNVIIENELKVKNIQTENRNVVNNLNAELFNGFRSPNQGEIVSTMDEQVLYKKSFGDHIHMRGNRITSVGYPIHREDVATREFVENWVNGIQPKMAVRAATTKKLVADFMKDEEGCAFLLVLENPFLVDDVEIQRLDSILVKDEDQMERHGVYYVERIVNGRSILKRRHDCLPGMTKKELNGFYIWCRHGTENARTAWVLNTIPEDVWEEGMPIDFHLYYQASTNLREFGNGFHQTNEGRMELAVHKHFFDFQNGLLTIKPNVFDPLQYLTICHLDFDVGSGLKGNTGRVHLGEVLRLQLNWNPEHFYINGQNQLCLARSHKSYRVDSGNYVEWVDGVRCQEELEIEKEILFVKQISAPTKLKADFKVVKGNQSGEVQKRLWVQYWIAGIDENNHMTTAVSSSIGYHQIENQVGDKWFVKLMWEGSTSKYRLWRIRSDIAIQDSNLFPEQNENVEVSMIDIEGTYCLDILYPTSFQKLDWIPYDNRFPRLNETREIRGKLSTNEGSSFLNMPFSIGTLKPKASTLEVEEPAGRKTSVPAIRILTQPIPNGRAQIRWETVGNQTTIVPYIMEWVFMNEKRSKLEMGLQDTVLSLVGDKNRLWIVPESWKGQRKPLHIDDRVIIKDGGICVDGRIATTAPESFETEGTGILGNPAVLKTGMQNGAFMRPVGNGVSFSWKGNDLEAIPMSDGKQSGSSYPVKQFTIPHPNQPHKLLQHACLEGPSADVYQRGKIFIAQSEGHQYITLPDYWHCLVKPDTITVHLTASGPMSVWYHIDKTNVKVHWKQLELGNYEISYWIVGQRMNTEFEVEPDCDKVKVEHWGPYSWSVACD